MPSASGSAASISSRATSIRSISPSHSFGRHEGDPLDLYRALRKRQPVAYGGVVALGDETVVSLSPEVFFEAHGRAIRARPMKGTAQRGVMPTEDMARAQYLVEDEKSRAENLMIVDLLRNDLSRLADVGSVKVTDLFTVETYPTLHQMTSGIEARLRENVALADLFQGLFPCGSVTGAPKIRAMEIIRELECAARGVYCGSLGRHRAGWRHTFQCRDTHADALSRSRTRLQCRLRHRRGFSAPAKSMRNV